MPVVQLFLGKGDDKIRTKPALFGEDVWSRVAEKAEDYLYNHSELCRDGFFYFKK
jgi:hypothetical protein